jgi:hypothetical protein
MKKKEKLKTSISLGNGLSSDSNLTIGPGGFSRTLSNVEINPIRPGNSNPSARPNMTLDHVFMSWANGTTVAAGCAIDSDNVDDPVYVLDKGHGVSSSDGWIWVLINGLTS